MTSLKNQHFPLGEETDFVIRTGLEIHRQLGFGFLEIVYKDALEYELQRANCYYEREKEYKVKYKEIILIHRFYADFVVMDSVILEVKAKERICDQDLAQTINYLKCSGCKVGLILNFGRSKLDIKRVVF